MKKRIKNITYFRILVIAISILALSGCNSKPNFSQLEKGSDEVILKWAVWDIKDGSVEYDLVKAFEEANEGIKVELISIPSSDYQDKITIMLASGDTTDVITIKNAKQYAALAYSNVLLDMTAHVDNDVDTSVAQDEYDIFYTDEGKTFAQPIKSDAWYLFYNKDNFDEAGVSYPENITWDEYVDLAKDLTYMNDEGEQIYGVYQVTWPSIVQAVAYAQSDVDYTDTTDYLWLKDYYDIALKIQNKGYAVDYATNSAGNESSSHEAAFEGGTASMLIMGTWYVQTLVADIQAGDTDINWGIVQVPQKPDSTEPVTAAAVTGAAINANTKNQEAAQKFVDFLSSTEAAEIYASKGTFPAISNETITETLMGLEGMATDDLTAKTLNEEKKVVSELPVGKKVTDINIVLEETHSLIMIEEITVDEGIAEMEKRTAQYAD